MRIPILAAVLMLSAAAVATPKLGTNPGPKPAAKAVAVPAKPVALAPGPGQAVVQTKCVTCHPATQIVAAGKTREQWEMAVDNMIDRGARVSDAEFEVVVAYLARNYPLKK